MCMAMERRTDKGGVTLAKICMTCLACQSYRRKCPGLANWTATDCMDKRDQWEQSVALDPYGEDDGYCD